MKNLLLMILTFILSQNATAKEWLNDIEEAKAMAKQEQKNIVLVFAGSDWCAPCIRLEKEILETEQFQAYAKENFVLIKADFPRKKANRLSKEQEEKNSKLAEKYNSQGHFPLVVILNENGDVLGQTGYKKVSPLQYIDLLTSF